MKPDSLYKAVIMALSGTAIALCLSSSAGAGVPSPPTATKTDSLQNDADGNGKVNPGDRLKYSVNITNTTGAAIANVEFTDTLDPNTTLVSGSITAAPIAVSDNYSISGNTTLGSMFISASNGMLANDVDPNGTPGCTGCAVTVQTGLATTQGGTVDINADGSFEYFPAAGNTATDTFQYEITDAESKTDTGTVSILFPNLIWYVDNSKVMNGAGTLASPFNNIASAASASAAGDMIYVLTGNAPAVNGLNAGIVLKNNQMLLGQGVDLKVTFDGAEVVKFPAGTAPVITHTAGTAVTLAQNNAIKGLKIGDSTNPVIGAGITGTTVGTLTIENASVNASTGAAVNINGGTLAVSFASVSAGNNTVAADPANGIVLQNTTGTFAVTGSGGTCTEANTSGCTGGTIQNTTGADDSSAAPVGTGIVLNNAAGVSLTRMYIHDHSNYGIRGTGVNGFTLNNSVVGGANGTSTPNREGSVIFDNLSGTNAITSSVISGAIEDNLRVENTSGTLAAFNLTNSKIQNNSIVSGNIGFRFATATPGVAMTGTVSGTTFQGNRTIAVQADASNGTVNFTASNNTIIAGTGGNNQGNQGIEADVANNGVMNFSITGNKIGTDGITNQPLLNTGINIFNGTLVTSGTPASIAGTVTNNTVYNAGAGMSGFGIRLFNQGYGTMNANVSNNTVNNVGFDYGIFAEVSSNSGTANAAGSSSIAMTNNTSNVLSGALDAIRLQARGRSTMCARISGNASTTAGTGPPPFFGLEIRQATQIISGTTYQATFNLEGLTSGLQTNHMLIVDYLNNQNPAITGGADEIHSPIPGGGITGVANNSCSSIP